MPDPHPADQPQPGVQREPEPVLQSPTAGQPSRAIPLTARPSPESSDPLETSQPCPSQDNTLPHKFLANTWPSASAAADLKPTTPAGLEMEPRVNESRARLHSPLVLAGMIAMAALAMVGTLPGRTHGLGLITEGLLTDLRLDRAVYAQLNVIATLIGASFCWPCGWLLDRLGIRLTGLVVILGLGISTIGLACSTNAILLSIWMTLTRGFGQSMLSVVSLTLSGRASLGLRQATAMAAYSLLVSLFFMAAFRGLGWAIPLWGWRESWLGLGWTLACAALLFGLIVVEPRVEQGQDSDTREPHVSSATMRQALTSTAFWLFAISSALFAFVSSGLSLFQQSILAERQFDVTVYYHLLMVSTLAGLVGNLVTGLVSRWFEYNRLMAAAMTLYAIALVAFPLVRTVTEVYTYAIAMGCCGGMVTVVFFGVWSHAFGRVNLGKIQGLAQAFTVLASALGPWALAECWRIFGSYVPAFWGLAPSIAALAILAWLTATPSATQQAWEFNTRKSK